MRKTSKSVGSFSSHLGANKLVSSPHQLYSRRQVGPIVHRLLVTERRVARPTALLKWSLIADPND